MTAQPREIRRYIKPDGTIPFQKWFDCLRDRQAQVKIDARLDRVELGNLGDYRSVGEELVNLKLIMALVTESTLDKWGQQ